MSPYDWHLATTKYFYLAIREVIVTLAAFSCSWKQHKFFFHETLQEVISHLSLVKFEVLYIISKCSMYCKRDGINSTVTGPFLLLNWGDVHEVWIYFSIFLYSNQWTIDQGQLMYQWSVEITTTELAAIHCYFSPYTGWCNPMVTTNMMNLDTLQNKVLLSFVPKYCTSHPGWEQSHGL